MKKPTVSIRELQQNLGRLIARVERGETIEVTRRRRPVARLTPLRPPGRTGGWPDLAARTRAVFGKRVVEPGGSDLVARERGDR